VNEVQINGISSDEIISLLLFSAPKITIIDIGAKKEPTFLKTFPKITKILD
jgi:hypothetical protein